MDIGYLVIEDIEKELASSGWTPGPDSDQPILEKEIQAEIERTAQALDGNLRRRAELAGVAMLPDAPQERRRSMGTKPPCVLLLLGLVQNMGRPAEAFTAYDCSTTSNIQESY